MRINKVQFFDQIDWPFFFRIALVFIIFISTFILFYLLRPHTLGVNPDSVVYFGVAENLLSGKGLTVPFSYIYSNGINTPLTLWPPLYSLSLALMSWLGFNLHSVALYLNIFLFFINLSLAGYITYYVTRSAWITILIIIGEAILLSGFHSMAYSEPLFFTFMFLSILIFIFFISHPSTSLLFWGGLASAMAILTRYAGISLILFWVFCLFLIVPLSLKCKILYSICFSIISLIPIGIFIFNNFRFSKSMADRSFIFHPSSRFLPMIGLFCFLILILRMHLSVKSKSLLYFLLAYVITILITIYFLDASIPLDSRELSPLYLIGLIFLSIQKWFLPRKILAPGLLIIPLLLGFPHSYSLGYEDSSWRNSHIIQYLETLPNDEIIYSNGPDAIYYLTGRSSVGEPFIYNPITAEINPSYSIETDSLVQQIKKGAILINFEKLTGRKYYPSFTNDFANLPWKVLYSGDDGSIFQIQQFDSAHK